MTHDETHTIEELSARCAKMDIGAFSEIDYTPVEAMAEADDKRAVIRIFTHLHQDDADALRRHIENEKADAAKGVKLAVFSLVTRVISFILPPGGRFEPVNLWGVIYALDDEEYHCNVDPSSKARQLGVSRSAMSYAVRNAAAMFGLTGRNASRWMRSDETSAESARARNEFCAGDPPKKRKKQTNEDNE